MPTEGRALVNLPKTFRKKLGNHPTKEIMKTFEKFEKQKDEITRLEENTRLKQISTATEFPTEHIIQESENHQCPFHVLDGNGKVDCLKFYDKKGVIRQVPKKVCDQHWTSIQSTIQRKKEAFQKDAVIAEQFPCRCRFNHEYEWLCALKAPAVQKIEYGLKVCQACPTRLTKDLVKKLEAQGEFTETKRYITCGAKEKQDAKVGLLIYDSKNPACPHDGVCVPIQACFDAHCSYAKIMQVTPKRRGSEA
jgi:hypothetical protein